MDLHPLQEVEGNDEREARVLSDGILRGHGYEFRRHRHFGVEATVGVSQLAYVYR